MFIAVINQSKLVEDIDVDTMCQAIQIQLKLHVLPAYNMKSATVRFYADPSKAPGYAWLVSVLDSSSQANALGYHSEENGKVKGFIFCQPVLSNGGVILYDPNNPQNISVSSVLSHEICEMVVDRYANGWCDGPAIYQGSEYAQEICDPVENDSYVVVVNGQNVSVSNFVFPSWFNPEAQAPYNMPFDYLKKLTTPFTMSAGGYMIIRKAGRISQVFDKGMPEWRKQMKKNKIKRHPKKKTSIFGFLKD